MSIPLHEQVIRTAKESLQRIAAQVPQWHHHMTETEMRREASFALAEIERLERDGVADGH